MTREEVIKSLETAVKNFERYSGDEYGREYDYARVEVDVLEDALALLKAQEPVVPSWRRGIPFCGKCGRQFGRGFKYCPDCGQAVKWDG